MRILTVRRPWDWAIIHGGKNIENRSHNIAGSYRGPVAIHVAQQADKDVATLLDTNRALAAAVERAGVLPEPSYGAIIGVVDLVDVHEGHNTERDQFRAVRSCYQPGKPFGPCSPWAMPDHHHLVLANPRRLATPIPYRGGLGLRRIDADLEARIWAEVAS